MTFLGFSLIVQAGAFISAFAAVSAGILMVKVTQKFGTGILASGFKTISIGVFFIAAGIIFDSIQVYFNFDSNLNIVLIGLKELLFIIGAYTIVIGSKNMADKLETLTK